MNRPNQKVSILFKGYLASGEVFDECTEEPFEVTIGASQVMRPIDSALREMEPGEERTIEVPAREAYGEFNPEAVQKGPVFDVPGWQDIPVGEMIMWRYSEHADPVPARVLSLEDGVIELDFNHPLVGRDLTYWVKLIS